MKTDRAKARKPDNSAAPAALTALARLLARQAAREVGEYAKAGSKADHENYRKTRE